MLENNYKFRHRNALNDLPVTEAQIEAIVQEVIDAFALNRAVFYEQEDAVRAAIGEATFDLLTRLDKPGGMERAPGQTSMK